RVWRIGMLSTATPRVAPFYKAFERRLRELGYVEGQNLAIDFRNAEGQLDRLPGLAAELVPLNVNVIIAPYRARDAGREGSDDHDPHPHSGHQLRPCFAPLRCQPRSAERKRDRSVLPPLGVDGQAGRTFQGDATDDQPCGGDVRSVHSGWAQEGGSSEPLSWSQAPAFGASKSARSRGRVPRRCAVQR